MGRRLDLRQPTAHGLLRTFRLLGLGLLVDFIGIRILPWARDLGENLGLVRLFREEFLYLFINKLSYDLGFGITGVNFLIGMITTSGFISLVYKEKFHFLIITYPKVQLSAKK